MSEADHPRDRGSLWWYGEPVFESERWFEDGVWHVTAEEIGMMAAGASVTEAAEKLSTMVLDHLFFLSEIPDDEITPDEEALRSLILTSIGPAFVKHHRDKRGKRPQRLVSRLRCAMSGRVPEPIARRVPPSIRQGSSARWAHGRAPSGQRASAAASNV